MRERGGGRKKKKTEKQTKEIWRNRKEGDKGGINKTRQGGQGGGKRKTQKNWIEW